MPANEGRVLLRGAGCRRADGAAARDSGQTVAGTGTVVGVMPAKQWSAWQCACSDSTCAAGRAAAWRWNRNASESLKPDSPAKNTQARNRALQRRESLEGIAVGNYIPSGPKGASLAPPGSRPRRYGSSNAAGEIRGTKRQGPALVALNPAAVRS